MPDLADQQMIPGQVPVRINDTYAITIENLSVQGTRSVAVASGFAGNFAKRKGIKQFTFSFDMPPLVVGYEVPLAVLEQPFKLTYVVGSVEYDLDGCDLSDDSLSVAQQSGNTTSQFRGNALNRIAT